MNSENQALRLAQMMQNKVTAFPSYELVLPLVEVGRSKLTKLAEDDIVLLGFNDLKFALMEDEGICAHLTFKVIGERAYLEISDIDRQSVKPNNSKKFQTLKISLGKFQSRKLDVGYRIDITQRPLEDVTLIVEGNKHASGSLVNVDGEIAVKIDKVEI